MGVREGVEILYLVGSKLSIFFQLLFLSTQLYVLNSVLTDRHSCNDPFLFLSLKEKNPTTPKTKQ